MILTGNTYETNNLRCCINGIQFHCMVKIISLKTVTAFCYSELNLKWKWPNPTVTHRKTLLQNTFQNVFIIKFKACLVMFLQAWKRIPNFFINSFIIMSTNQTFFLLSNRSKHSKKCSAYISILVYVGKDIVLHIVSSVLIS